MIPRIWVRLSGGWWRHRERCLRARGPWRRVLVAVYKMYVEEHGGYVALGAEFAEAPRLPHELLSVFIAPGSRIGRRVTIHQQVVIGKNDDPTSSRYGSPTIGDDVYIGAGAKVIGAVQVGDGARIGAGTVVVKDVPAGATIVSAPAVVIERQLAANSNSAPTRP